MRARGREIVLLVEGATERAFKDVVKRFLDGRCAKEGRPKVGLTTRILDSRLLDGKTVCDEVRMALGRSETIGVVALIDVVCSGSPRRFGNAAEAIDFLQGAAPKDPRFRAHAAQYDFEAWLLPYWDDICNKLKIKAKSPGAEPEAVNHDKPPSRRLKDLYRKAPHHRDYDKVRDARAILEGKDLILSARKCHQLKAFLNSLLTFAGCREIE